MLRRRQRTRTVAASRQPDVTVDDLEMITDESFLSATAGRITFVDFWAPWCAPCRVLEPVFAELSRTYRDRVTFARCNVDENAATAGVLQIGTIPTLVLFGRDGSEITRVVGLASPRQLAAVLDDVMDAA